MTTLALPRPTRITATVGALLLLALTDVAIAAEHTRVEAWRYKPDASVTVVNLLGTTTVESSNEQGVHITARVLAEGKDAAAAQALAQKIRFVTRDAGANSALEVHYPIDQALYFEGAGPGNSWLRATRSGEYLDRRYKMSGDRDSAAVIRVNLLVRAPQGARLSVSQISGNVVANGFDGALSIETADADVESRRGRGSLEVDAGSGGVRIAGHAGEVFADTGSGGVAIDECRCRIQADTGSGRVRVTRSEGEFEADTGSGDVIVDGFGGSIAVDTGSGDVRISNARNVDSFAADTGSGDVSLGGDLSTLRRLAVDTGSGSVDITSTTTLSLRLAVDTGSGDVDLDVPASRMQRDGDGRWILELGASAGRGDIDTGSGDVSVRLVGPSTPGATPSPAATPVGPIEPVAPIRPVAPIKPVAKPAPAPAAAT